MEGYVPGEQPDGFDIIKLNTNENPYLPSPEIQDMLQKVDVAALTRYPDPMCMEVRRVIAELHGVSIENVFAGNGSDEVLALCTRALVEPDGAVGWFEPSYSLYSVLAQIADVETRPVELDENFGWQMPEEYEASLFFITNPNAPTGMLFPKKKVEAFVREFSGVVVIDEAYVDFAREHCMELAGKHDNVLVARTLSKSYALAGIRFGYCIGAAPLIAALCKIKDSYNLNTLTQAVGGVALLDQQTMESNCAAVVGTRMLMTEELEHGGFKVFPSEANFLWVRPPEEITARKLFEELRERKILVRWFDGERTEDCLRITVGTNEQAMKLVETIEKILGK